MNQTNPSTYHMLAIEESALSGDAHLNLPAELAQRIRPGDGLVLAHWRDDTRTGKVSGLAVVTDLDPTNGRAEIEYAATSLTLKPHPSGRRWWRNTHFEFAKSVRERYMLDDIFAEHFPGYADLNITPRRNHQPTHARTYQPVAGYIYVLQSQYGYKIGKTVNLKDRTRLFEVKLPFKFDLVISGYIDNYSKAEAELHRMFADKRLEGEWFDLTTENLEQVRKYLESTA